MTSTRAEGILFPAISRSWGCSAQFVCNGALCKSKPMQARGRVHRPTQECEACYEQDLRQRCGLSTKVI